MDLQLKGSTAMVAGSSRGIGYAIARAFLREGCRVAVTGRGRPGVEAATEALRGEFGDAEVVGIAGDLGQSETVRNCRRTIRELWTDPDFVVANVGSGRSSGETSPDFGEWQKAFDVNMWASVRVVQEFLPAMTERRSGSIVVIGSIAGSESIAAPVAYGAAKAALAHWTKSLARRCAPSGIRANLITPGNVLFEGGSWDQRMREDPGRVREYVEAEVPLGRFGQPEEIADLAVFLCSPRAGFITGARIAVDGGQTRGM